jgi:hypothetical protein
MYDQEESGEVTRVAVDGSDDTAGSSYAEAHQVGSTTVLGTRSSSS